MTTNEKLNKLKQTKLREDTLKEVLMELDMIRFGYPGDFQEALARMFGVKFIKWYNEGWTKEEMVYGMKKALLSKNYLDYLMPKTRQREFEMDQLLLDFDNEKYSGIEQLTTPSNHYTKKDNNIDIFMEALNEVVDFNKMLESGKVSLEQTKGDKTYYYKMHSNEKDKILLRSDKIIKLMKEKGFNFDTYYGNGKRLPLTKEEKMALKASKAAVIKQNKEDRVKRMEEEKRAIEAELRYEAEKPQRQEAYTLYMLEKENKGVNNEN